jgi:hypothetical protein
MKKTRILLLVAMNLLGCSKSVPPPNVVDSEKRATNLPPANSAPVPEVPPEQTTPASSRGVKTEMRNVLFHLTDKAAARLETLSGELWPVGKNEMPVFDDKTSFEVRVSSGKVSITPEALSSILNDYVFAKKEAPLKDLSVSIDKGQLVIKGKLHSKGDIPFETKGTVSTTPDGRLRVHTERVKALHVPVKGVMGVFGIELADVVNTSKIDGLDTDKNDLVMDLGMLLPPPHIKGKVTAVKIEKNTIVTIFGDGAKISAPMKEKGNYMYFEGNAVRFGKLVMENTDLTVLDIDTDDALDWSQDHYKDQLVAGYSKITPSFGLRAYVKDYSKLPRSQANTSSRAPAN